MVSGFKDFLLKNQVVSLAVAVIIGGAVGKVVTSLVADIVMPLISLALPGGEWRTAKIILSQTTGPDGKEVINAINIGTFLGNTVDFIVIAFCVYVIAKVVMKEEPKLG
jgi:large conductance mechanosensitive channel